MRVKTEEDRSNDAKMRGLYNYRIYVVGGGYEYIKMFHDAGFAGARSVSDADIICFTGGEDVDPQLYGERALNTTYFNPARDQKEMEIFADAAALGKPMVGICRGSQFLNVMNGGKLWQHVNSHAVARGHAVLDVATGKTIPNMTSTHHQMMIPAKDTGLILALAQEATYKQNASKTWESIAPKMEDVESVWYAGTKSLCFQPHPEYKSLECRDYFLHLFDSFILPACTND